MTTDNNTLVESKNDFDRITLEEIRQYYAIHQLFKKKELVTLTIPQEVVLNKLNGTYIATIGILLSEIDRLEELMHKCNPDN